MKDTKITFRLNEREKKELELIAKSKEIPVSQMIREAVKQYLNKGE